MRGSEDPFEFLLFGSVLFLAVTMTLAFFISGTSNNTHLPTQIKTTAQELCLKNNLTYLEEESDSKKSGVHTVYCEDAKGDIVEKTFKVPVKLSRNERIEKACTDLQMTTADSEYVSSSHALIKVYCENNVGQITTTLIKGDD